MLCKLSNLLIMLLLLLSCVCILHSLHAQFVTASGLFWIRWWQATIQTFQEIITLSGQNQMSSMWSMFASGSAQSIKNLHHLNSQHLHASRRLALAFFAAAAAAASCFAFLVSSTCAQTNPTRSYHLPQLSSTEFKFNRVNPKTGHTLHPCPPVLIKSCQLVRAPAIGIVWLNASLWSGRL